MLPTAHIFRHELMFLVSCAGLSSQACRDGFLWCTRSYLRSWDRGLAVVVPAATAGLSASAAEASGKLAAGVDLLLTTMRVAEGALPSVSL